MSKGKKIHIGIIGGGSGGLTLARKLAKGLKSQRASIALFDKTNHHLFQPLLYQVATAGLSPGDIAVPIRETLKQLHKLRRFKTAGFVAWLLWTFVHIFYQIDFRNRIIVITEWIWQYITFNRTARLITGKYEENEK